MENSNKKFERFASFLMPFYKHVKLHIIYAKALNVLSIFLYFVKIIETFEIAGKCLFTIDNDLFLPIKT